MGHLLFPEVFSLIDNPIDAIRTLGNLASMVLNPRCARIRIDQSSSALIDHGAASIVNALADAAMRSHGMAFEGMLPRSPNLAEIVNATGLPRALGLTAEKRFDKFITFELCSGRGVIADAYQSTDRDRISEAFSEYLNECLAQYDCELSAVGQANLIRLLTEAMENVERHSGQDRWWISGYLRQGDDDAAGDCYVCIFNIGRSIYESLSTLPSESLLRKEITELVDSHKRRGFFGSSTWSEETLWTLYALQEGVSCRNKETVGLGHNGYGTVQMMQFFETLGGTDGPCAPRMCVLSGATHILLDGKYKMYKKSTSDGRFRNTIAFNSENDLHVRPDKSYVRSLPVYFPGTVISMRFPLDRAYLKRMVKSDD